MKTVQLNGELRSNLGKKDAKSVRRNGAIPAVVYNKGNIQHFTVNPLEVRELVYTSEFKLANISVDGKNFTSFIKDIQFHPVTDDIVHIDFLNIEDGVTFKAAIPISFEGTAAGVKEGGKLQKAMRRVRVKTTLANLKDKIVADVTDLEMGGTLRVKDLEALEGIEVMEIPNIPIALIEVPRAMKSQAAADEAAEGEEGAEGAAPAADAAE